MIGKKIIEGRPISSAEVKAILGDVVKKYEEPLYEQKITIDHLAKFSKLKPETAKQMIKELMESNEKIKPEIAVKIVDLLPKDGVDIRAIFAKERFAITKEEIEGILEILAKYR